LVQIETVPFTRVNVTALVVTQATVNQGVVYEVNHKGSEND